MNENEEVIVEESEAEATETEAVDTAEEEANQQESEASEAEEEQAEQTSDAEVSEADEQENNPLSDVVYTPVYNGKVCPISASETEEITQLIQLGMKQRDFAPEREALTQLAHEFGIGSVKELISTLQDNHEERLKAEAIQAYGEEAGARFYESEKAQRTERYNKLKAEREEAEKTNSDISGKLADQFVELQSEYPNYADFKSVPKAVINMAMKKNISLLDAQNRITIADQKKSSTQKTVAATADKASVGSLSDGSGATTDPVLAAALAGLRGRI